MGRERCSGLGKIMLARVYPIRSFDCDRKPVILLTRVIRPLVSLLRGTQTLRIIFDLPLPGLAFLQKAEAAKGTFAPSVSPLPAKLGILACLEISS
jgi:hypothetical protein